MARRPRLEVEGGLYHLITRGVERRDIFHTADDYRKFLSLLAVQKEKLPFFLYAYCLMTNHVHLLIERMTDDVGRIMHRVLTGYTQYYNRKYRRSGHLLQGRHKAILCQSDPYTAELVRYIHLNPVRAKIVRKVENYPYTSHRSYMGLEPVGIVDVDPVLRRFGPRKALARERYAKFVAAGMKLGHMSELYETQAGILGSEEFVDEVIHRMGEFIPKGTWKASSKHAIKADDLVSAVERLCDIRREDICSKAKGRGLVTAREILILTGRRAGLNTKALSEITGLSIATISRRHDAVLSRIKQDGELRRIADDVLERLR
jgi:REP element-mobilizing transposase RayT